VIAAVTGATGYVGQFVVRRLLAEGARVRAWRRAGSTGPRLSADVEWIAGDLRDPPSMAALAEGADALVHCALDHAPGRYRGGEGADLAGFVDANVAGSVRLLRAAHAAGVRRCVVLSSRAVFGDARPAGILADDALPRPDTHYGAAKMALEAFVSSFAQREGWAVAALRPTGVYGLVEPLGRTKWFDLVAALLDGRRPPPRAGTEVHGGDVAEAVWRLLTADPERIAGRAFNCSDIAVDAARICAIVRELTGIDAPPPPDAPGPRVLMACPGLEALGMRFGGEPLLRRTLGELVRAVQGRLDAPDGAGRNDAAR
jgi:nucleoside-diphosphate-sugar epimerase